MDKDWNEINNAQAKIIYELTKKIRDEKRALKRKHVIECEIMLLELLTEEQKQLKSK